jgi:iron complex outermembrane receptor protein
MAAGAVLLLGWSGALAEEASAQSAGAIEEVVVTAERREASLQDTPIAISALTADELADRGITGMEGVAAATPSISFTPYPSSSNTLILFIRGQGVSDPGQITLDSAVGLYQDGFYIPRGQMATFDLADIERVEVLRGPQGTLYGRNTTGGAVNLISNKPGGEFGFRQEIGIGNNGRVRSLTVLDLPKWGGLAAKLSFLKRKQDGYVRNAGPGHDYGEEDQAGGRAALRWDNGGAFTADYFFETGDMDSTPVYYTNAALAGLIPGYSAQGRPEGHTYRAIDLPGSEGEYEAHGLTLSWDVNDALTLRSLTGYRDVATNYVQDYADAFFAGFRTDDDVRYHVLSQELQAVGSLFDGRLDYVAGLYYYEESGRHYETVDISQMVTGQPIMDKERLVEAQARSRAAFAQVTWTPPVLGDRLDLVFGARYTKDEREATRQMLNRVYVNPIGFIPVGQEPGPGIVNSNDVESSRFNPAFTASFSWNDDLNTYLRASTGYKAGGSSEGMEIGQFGLTFEPEDVTTLELGLKSYFFDRHLRLNAALFDSRFEDMQMFFVSSSTDNSVILALNSGKATVRGLELDLLWQPTAALGFTFDYTYLDAKRDEVIVRAGTIYDPAVNAASPYLVGQNIKELFRVSYAPENSLNLGANWTFLQRDGNEATAILNYRWEDRNYITEPSGDGVPNNQLYSRPAFGLLDARLSWRMDLAGDSRARVDLWGRNLADKAWLTHRIAQGGSVAIRDPYTGNVTPAGYFATADAWAERRTYGVNFVYEY